MRVFQIITFIYLVCCSAFNIQAKEEVEHRVLMVLSSYGEKSDQGELLKPGYEFDELTKSYIVFKHYGVTVDIASPSGGKVVADEYDPKKPYNQLFLNDKQAMRHLNNTLKLTDVDTSRYSAVFVVGGKGPMFDLHQDKQLRTIIRDVYEQGGIASAVCHGPAALVNVTLSDGSYLIKGKRVNGFTNREEAAFGKKWTQQFAFLLEDKLRERGALFESADIMLNHVAQDGRLITGQNPFSTVDTALAVVHSLGFAPKPFTTFKDDATMKIVARILDNDEFAVKEFSQQAANYQVELAAMYGFYRFKLAKAGDDITGAVKLMQLTYKTLKAAPLDLALAKGLLQLNKAGEAKEVLDALLKTTPDMEEAQALLKKVTAAL